MKKDIIIVSIESSCDDTCVAVVKNGREVMSSIISSQIDIHNRFGGVVPEIASRNHITAIDNVYNLAMEQAGITINAVDAIAVTYGSGLLGSLLVGVSFAKALAFASKKPLIAVSHIQGHIAANYISHQNLKPPFICLLVSGGHTAILHVTDYNTHKLIGSTLDDAVGEAFDKVARVLSLGYPGGPAVQKTALGGSTDIQFNKSMHGDSLGLNFSFSGKKTAVINYIHKLESRGEKVNAADVCASFQKWAVDDLVTKTIKACLEKNVKTLCIAGGVSANEALRNTAQKECEKNGISLFVPEFKYCMDNAAMIGCAAYYQMIAGAQFADNTLTPNSNVDL